MNEYKIVLNYTLDAFLKQEILNEGYSNRNEYIVKLLENKRLKKLPQTLSDIQKLMLFNKKADRLEKYSLWTHLDEHQPSVRLSNGEMLHQQFPSEESLDAVMVTLRLFMQDNDHISVRNMGKIYENNPKISQQLKDNFFIIRNRLNKFLDKNSGFIIQSEIWINEVRKAEKKFTMREILERILYGEIAHFTQMSDYQEICRTPWTKVINFMLLYQILKGFKQAILEIADVNVQAIAEINSPQ